MLIFVMVAPTSSGEDVGKIAFVICLTYCNKSMFNGFHTLELSFVDASFFLKFQTFYPNMLQPG